MENRPAILKTKLRIPKIPGAVKRERLLPVLSAIDRKKTAVVVAGAGYGKTTLVAQVLEVSGIPAVWYSLDETDVDLSVFMTYLLNGIRQHHPTFGQRLLGQTGIISGSDRSRENFLISLLEEIEGTLSEDLVVVLDDYYTVQDNPKISESLSFLLNRLPPSIHFVIVSRIEPDIRLSKLRSMSEVIDIGENDLGFRSEEVKRLYDRILKLRLSENQVQKVRKRTDGWAAGLILFYHSIKGLKADEIDVALDRMERLHKTLRSYFEENVFEELSLEIRDFMLKTSILSSMTADFCNRFLGIDRSAEILAVLEESHLFTFCSQEEQPSYTYHQLLKDFLKTKLEQQTDRKNLEKLHCKVGDLLWKNKYREDALLHYLEGNDIEKSCRLFLELDLSPILTGRLNLIRLFHHKVPEARINRDPHLLLLKARSLFISGNPNTAIESLQAGLKIVSQTQSEEHVARFQKELGQQFYYAGDIPRAISQLRAVLKNRKCDPLLFVEATGILAFLFSVQGKTTEADKMLTVAQDSIDRIEGDMKSAAIAWSQLYQSFRYYCSGEHVKSKLYALDSLRTIEKLNIVAFLPLAYLQLSQADTSLGDHRIAIENAGKGIETAVEMEANDYFLAWLYVVVGQANLGLGCFDEALRAAESSLDLFGNIGNKWGMATAHDLFSRIYLRKNEDREVEHHLELGYEAIKGQQLPLARGLLDTAKILLLIKNGRMEAALERIHGTLPELGSSKHLTCLLLLLQAGLYLKTNKRPSAIQSFREGLRIAVENDYPISSFYELQPIWPELLDLKSHEKLAPSWNEAMGKNRRDPDGFPDAESSGIPISTDFPEMRIECFGRFRAFKGGIEIPVESWKSSKTEQLFKYMVSKSDCGYISRDVLIEVLWPDETASKCLNRLNVALTTLRNFLEPGRKPGEGSNYVLRQKDAYRIDLGVAGTTDIRDFLKTVESGDRESLRQPENPGAGIEFYLEAEFIRKGEFLENDRYLDWCNDERERLNLLYLSTLHKIIDFYEDKADYHQGLRFAEKALSLDQYSENTYRKMMIFYSRIGNNPMVLKTFKKCKSYLEKDLNCPPTWETIDLFNQLTRSDRSN
ncbi:MAG: hypothetical protein GY866_07880 [Proteobacteria bacterium]|nr:hypothetical protein [Pseudomonadota bacterium]